MKGLSFLTEVIVVCDLWPKLRRRSADAFEARLFSVVGPYGHTYTHRTEFGPRTADLHRYNGTHSRVTEVPFGRRRHESLCWLHIHKLMPKTSNARLRNGSVVPTGRPKSDSRWQLNRCPKTFHNWTAKRTAVPFGPKFVARLHLTRKPLRPLCVHHLQR